MILQIILHTIAFILGFILGRALLIVSFVLYNNYRVHSKFKKLYKKAVDERMRRDLLIDYSRMDRSIPVNIVSLILHLEQGINCNDLLSSEMYYFLYEY